MKLTLAFDTSTEEVAIGLGKVSARGVHLLGETNINVPRASLTHLFPAITRLLQSADRTIGDVDAVVVGRGPGSFTGVRIGVSASKGIAQGRGIPLFGINTLDAVAERFSGRQGLVGVIGDAMRSEVYPALYRLSGGTIERLTGDAVASPAVVAAEWATLGEPVLLSGNALRKYADAFTTAMGDGAIIAPEALWPPTGESLLMVAWRFHVRDELGDGDPGTLLPVYTRLSDAEEAERSGDRATGPSPRSGVAGPHDAGDAP
ncbi:MAG TPA: tRNA (adenosine(37)-N6)-threonylcarbamoyltransferase complex dimerization subunit type 1 TsaB [Coriobacteriia bacterium]